jgi:hypothetical protein
MSHSASSLILLIISPVTSTYGGVDPPSSSGYSRTPLHLTTGREI